MNNVILFGASKLGKTAINFLKYHYNILFFVDNDKNKWNKEFYGYLVKPIDEIRKADINTKVIISSQYSEEIEEQLKEMGITNFVNIDHIYDEADLKCMKIMNDHVKRQDVINSWMNHIKGNYELNEYREALENGDKYKRLDVGCGCGKQFFNWMCMGYEVDGIEICEWKIDFIKQKIDDLNFPKEWKERIHFAYGEDLPFEDHSFDVVTSWYVLEHVTNYVKCIEEMLRVVKQDGLIIINGPDYRNSFEEHYLLDFGKSIVDNKEEFRNYLVKNNKNLDIFNELNFITKDSILEVIKKYEERTGRQIQVVDLEERYHEPRERASVNYRIAYIIKMEREEIKK